MLRLQYKIRINIIKEDQDRSPECLEPKKHFKATIHRLFHSNHIIVQEYPLKFKYQIIGTKKYSNITNIKFSRRYKTIGRNITLRSINYIQLKVIRIIYFHRQKKRKARNSIKFKIDFNQKNLYLSITMRLLRDKNNSRGS